MVAVGKALLPENGDGVGTARAGKQVLCRLDLNFSPVLRRMTKK